MLCLCEPSFPEGETCNGRDDDCDGIADNGASCHLPGEVCTNGACGCPEERRCQEWCADLDNDTTNCGACGNVCPLGADCVGGSCACPEAEEVCGGRCVDTDSDAANCGGCGNACAVNEQCTAGVCGCGGDLCGGVCTDRNTDPENCGACGRSCLGGACAAGVCKPKVLVSNVTTHGPLIVDGPDLYYSTWKEIRRIGKDGAGGSKLLVDSGELEEYPTAATFALDQNYIFWSSRYSGTVRSYRSGGGSVQMSTEGGGVATDGQHLFFMRRGALTNRPFSRIDREGTNLLRLLEGSRYNSIGAGPLAILLDETHAYVAFPRWIVRVPKEGGEPEDIATDLNIYGAAMAATEKSLYLSVPGGIMSVPKAGGAPWTVTECEGAYGAIAIEGGDLFYICGQDLYTKPLNGGPARALVRSLDNRTQGFKSGLAVDSTAIYFSEQNRILRLAR